MLKERDVVEAIAALKAIDKSKNNCDLLKEIVKHCGVTDATARKWLRGEIPRGLLQVKLTQYLVYQGVLTKSKTLHATLDYLAQLIAFSVISAEDACEYLNIGGMNPSKRIYPMFREEDGAPVCVLRGEISLSELQDSYDDELRAVKDRILRFADLIVKQPKIDAPPIDVEVSESDVLIEKELVHQAVQHHPDLLGLAAQLSSVMPGLRYLCAYSSPEERSIFRELMGETGMFDLGNLFEWVSSERLFSKRGKQ